jgi:hypothetical protein
MAMEGVLAKARSILEEAEQQRVQGLAEVAMERTKMLAEVAKQEADLRREVAAMHSHQDAHEGRVDLNIGGVRYITPVQALRRVPHTFFDAYFSGRYAQDVCRDGSIFVDRDGEHTLDTSSNTCATAMCLSQSLGCGRVRPCCAR